MTPMLRRSALSAVLSVIVLLVFGNQGTAADDLGEARALYASASYEEALVTLARLRAERADTPTLEQVDTYRAFCLFALGRTQDAQAIADDLISKDPALALDANDVSPRIAAIFTDARRRLLPDIIRNHYRVAKMALEKKDYGVAAPELELVRRALQSAEQIGILDETSAALREVVDAFVDFVQTAKSAEATVADLPPAARSTAPPTLTTPPGTPAVLGLFDVTSPGVTPPVTLVQSVPEMSRELRQLRSPGRSAEPGLLELIIDEQGHVERAQIRLSLLPAYDQLLLNATKQWRYKPAMKDGRPVKFEKVIALALPQS